MKGVILAAGDGGRLRPLTLGAPKVLMEIGGYPLIQYSLDALRDAGISDVAVVVGYRARQVQEALEKRNPHLTFVYNERFLGGNAMSVYAARGFVREEPFVLCMGDHPISPDIVRKLVTNRHPGCVLCIDPEAWLPSQISDGTRTLVDAAGHLMAIGKDLKVWNAIDTGVFKMTKDFFPSVEHLMMGSQGADVSISEVARL